MTPGCRPVTAAVAAAAIAVAIGLAVRGIRRTAVAAGPGEPLGPLLGPRVRTWYRGLLAPFEEALVAWRVRPDAVTWTQLVVSVLAGAAFATGAMFLAGWLTILAGTLDVLDGGVARRAGSAGARGALVDSLVDRYAEFATFLGLGAYFRERWTLLAVALAAFGSIMVSYTRARAEGLGLEMSQGSVQRPERYVILGMGAFVSSLVAHLVCGLIGRRTHAVLEGAIVGLAVVSLWTAFERARLALRALAERERP